MVIKSIKQKIILLFLLLITIIVSVIIYRRYYSNIDYTFTAYEKELVEYFKEVALESEYDSHPNKIIKWERPMLLFISKDETYNKQVKIVKNVINNINLLSTDGFEIEIKESPKECNAFLYLCPQERVAELNPFFYQMFNDGIIDRNFAGLAYTEFNWDSYNIFKTMIFIDSQESMNRQESAILEEITQSIGLMNDSKRYSNSVFYENKADENTFTRKYSKIDNDIIKLLYHPKMKSGLNAEQVEKVIKRILKNREIELSEK